VNPLRFLPPARRAKPARCTITTVVATNINLRAGLQAGNRVKPPPRLFELA
jgi:hypothetical protein